jgi:hypothetical protein
MQSEAPDTNPIITREDFRLLKLLGGYAELQGELQRDTVKLVYPHAAARSGNLPVTTPLGIALLGLREGQEIEWNFPLEGRHRLRVEAVLSQPQRGATSPSDAFVVPWEPRALDFDRKD